MNTPENTTTIRTKRNRGMLLVEMLIYLAIFVTVVAGIGVAMWYKGKLAGDTGSVANAVSNASTALTLYTQSPGYAGVIPITEGNGIPLTGTMGGASNTVISNATTLTQVLLTQQCLTAPISISLGTDTGPAGTATIPVLWNTTTQTFYTTGDVTPNFDYSNSRTLECKLSTPGVLPSTAAGGNFRLDGANDLPANVHVVYFKIPGVSAESAYQCAKTLYKGVVATQGTAQDAGPVTYAAADAQGKTTVYIYVAHN